MKTQFLLPHPYRKVGFVLLGIVGVLLLIIEIWGDIQFLKEVKILAIWDTGTPLQTSSDGGEFFRIITDDIQFELISVLSIIGGLFVAFSRQKNEDEFISKIRLESLVWATYVHFITLTVMILAIYGLGFLNILMANMFTILFLFIVRFQYKIYKSNKALRHAE